MEQGRQLRNNYPKQCTRTKSRERTVSPSASLGNVNMYRQKSNPVFYHIRNIHLKKKKKKKRTPLKSMTPDKVIGNKGESK